MAIQKLNGAAPSFQDGLIPTAEMLRQTEVVQKWKSSTDGSTPLRYSSILGLKALSPMRARPKCAVGLPRAFLWYVQSGLFKVDGSPRGCLNITHPLLPAVSATLLQAACQLSNYISFSHTW